MTPTDQRIAVIAAVTAYGGPKRFSTRFDISQGHIEAVIRGTMLPGKRTLKAAGIRG